MSNCKICGRPIVECDMKICRKCRSGERTTPLSLLKKAVKNINKIAGNDKKGGENYGRCHSAYGTYSNI